MKKLFLLLLAPALLVACHTRQQQSESVSLQAEAMVNDTLVTIYEGWAESADGQAILYDLFVLTPMNGGDELYQMVMSYTDSATMADTSVMIQAQVMPVPAGMPADTLIVFFGKNGEDVSLLARGDSMLVGMGRDIKKFGRKAAHVLHRLK